MAKYEKSELYVWPDGEVEEDGRSFGEDDGHHEFKCETEFFMEIPLETDFWGEMYRSFIEINVIEIIEIWPHIDGGICAAPTETEAEIEAIMLFPNEVIACCEANHDIVLGWIYIIRWIDSVFCDIYKLSTKISTDLEMFWQVKQYIGTQMKWQRGNARIDRNFGAGMRCAIFGFRTVFCGIIDHAECGAEQY